MQDQAKVTHGAVLTIQLQANPSKYNTSSPKRKKSPRGRKFPIMHFYRLITFATVVLALPTPDIAIQEKVLNNRAFEPEDKVLSGAIIPQDLVPRDRLDDILKIVFDKEPIVVPLIVW